MLITFCGYIFYLGLLFKLLHFYVYMVFTLPIFQRKLSRKERRKASQLEREREREAARITGSRVLHHDPYR